MLSAEEFFQADDLCISVYKKYALRDREGNFMETCPEQTIDRVMTALASVDETPEETKKKFIEACAGFQGVVPQGSVLFGAGNPYHLSSLSNCFVLSSPQDSIHHIFETGRSEAQLMKRRGGVGFDLSELRPCGASTNNSSLTSSGAVGWADFFSNVCRSVGQAGRRGALMLTLDIKHPDAELFATMKKDLTKVTGANVSLKISDEFMKAVETDSEFVQQWPVKSETPLVKKIVKAKALWQVICQSAWEMAEPGLLMWDNMIRNLPAHCYPNFFSTSTNPCFAGDTLIAVADGRGCVRFDELAKEGKDVPIHAIDEKGRMIVKTMRHPRITGYNQDIYKITLDDGSVFKATPNHKFLMLDGTYKELKDLTFGESLHMGWKYEASIKDIFPKANSHSQDYLWLKNSVSQTNRSEHRLIYQYYNGNIPKAHIIHHKDFNAQNNNIENLECMSKKDHDKFHSVRMKGLNNPIFKIKSDPEKFAEYSKKQSLASAGERNANFSGFTNEELKNHALLLTKQLGHRFSIKEWTQYADIYKLPKQFSLYRQNIFLNPIEMAKWAALQLGYNNIECDPRLVKTLQNALEMQYQAFIKNNEVFVVKKCEFCKENFEIVFWKREQGFCNHTCSNLYIQKHNYIQDRKRIEKTLNTYKNKSQITKFNQAKIFNDLKFNLHRDPLLKEWKFACSKEGIPHRIKTKFGFIYFKDLKNYANVINHKIISIEYLGKETVYNGTVDDVHNFYSVGNISTSQYGKKQWCLINSRQCGEIVLSPEDSCRLISINISRYVKEAFTKNAEFQMDDFERAVHVGMHMSDNLVELELRHVQTIMEKADSEAEQQLWKKIYEAGQRGRRTGLGTHGLADCIARLGLRYDGDKALEFIETVYQKFRNAAYEASILLSEKRGPFPDWNFDQEKDCEFFQTMPPHIKEEMKKFGRRNISLLTMAPTGSVSILSKVSSGIEPVFRNWYTRRRKINHNDKEARVDFVDGVGDRWQEYKVFHWNAKDYMVLRNIKDEKELPDYFVTSEKIDWKKRVEIQGIIQHYIDHSISSTINLPKETSMETVSELYFMGWKKGLKGITVYRDGCRSGVLLSQDSNYEARPKKIMRQGAPKRLDILPCDIHHTIVGGHPWVVMVGKLEGQPYEVFAGKARKVQVPKKYIEGVIAKEKKSYFLIFNDDMKLDIIDCFDNEEQQAMTRLLSMSMRHGVPLPYIVQQLDKVEGSKVMDLNRAIMRILKKYMKEEDVKMLKCDSCGETSLVMENGCYQCKNCGQSKCS